MDLRSVVDEVLILRPGCRGQRWEKYCCMWGWNEVKWVDRGAAVWSRVALCLAGASCDWLGGNVEKLIRQITYC